jgi:hypothetical protein
MSNLPIHPNLPALLATIEAAGIRLWPEGDSIHYRTPYAIPPDLREAIATNKPALLDVLTDWDAKEAIRLEFAADGEVERLGCRGNDPEIQEQARRSVEAHRWRDMAGVRAGCARVEARARELDAAKQAA